MERQELLKNIADDSETEKLLLAELQYQLNKELNKSLRKRDFDKIEELTSTIRELTDSPESIAERTRNGTEYLCGKLKRNRKRSGNRFMYTGAAVLCGCIVLVMGFNIYSLSAFGRSFFSAVVNFSKNGVIIDFSSAVSSGDIPENSESDKYGFRAKYAYYGIEAESPEYIPEGFELEDFCHEDMSESSIISFYYKKDGAKLDFSVETYNNGSNIPSILIPDSEYDVREELLRDHYVYIISDNNSFTAAYRCGNTVYIIFSDGLPYSEFEKTVESMS